jgi:hypothetical protein
VIGLGCILVRSTSLPEHWICDALLFGVYLIFIEIFFFFIKLTGRDFNCVVRYFMNEPIIDPAGPSLGSLRIYTRTEDKFSGLPVMGQMVVIWRLQNHQGSAWKMGRALIQQSVNYRVSLFLPVRIYIIYKSYLKMLLTKVVIEGLWGSSRGTGSISIDDISFYEGSCSSNIFIILFSP